MNSLQTVLREFDWALQETAKKYPPFQGNPQYVVGLVDRYSEPWRKYHTVDHIANGFMLFRTCLNQITNPALVWWAWLFHDISYIPDSMFNEYHSACLAREYLTACGMELRMANEVYDWILSTERHVVPPSARSNVIAGRDADIAILIDVDLAPLGADSWNFEQESNLLLEEHKFLKLQMFYEKRMAFVRSMLSREKIYLSPSFAHLEEQAQRNLGLLFAQWQQRQTR